MTLLLSVTVAMLVIALIGAVLALRLRRPRLVIVSAAALLVGFVCRSFLDAPVPGWASVTIAVLGLGLATIGGGPVVQTTLDLATPGQRTGSHGGIMLTGPLPVATTPTAAPGPAPTAAASTAAASTTAAPTAAAPTAIGQPIEVLRGGTTIGILERIAAAGSIMTGAAEAIAVVIAIKGVGRFSELSSPEARERFIIGTLASLIWASACGTLARLYLG